MWEFNKVLIQTLEESSKFKRFKDKDILCVSDFSTKDDVFREEYPNFVRNPRIRINGKWECHQGTFLLNNDGSVENF